MPGLHITGSANLRLGRCALAWPQHGRLGAVNQHQRLGATHSSHSRCRTVQTQGRRTAPWCTSLRWHRNAACGGGGEGGGAHGQLGRVCSGAHQAHLGVPGATPFLSVLLARKSKTPAGKTYRALALVAALEHPIQTGALRVWRLARAEALQAVPASIIGGAIILHNTQHRYVNRCHGRRLPGRHSFLPLPFLQGGRRCRPRHAALLTRARPPENLPSCVLACSRVLPGFFSKSPLAPTTRIIHAARSRAGAQRTAALRLAGS